ncbi:MAG: crotonase/enoyl-CoA hydratase family protein [Myxococcota bacterium]
MIEVSTQGAVHVITINRPAVRNAVDRDTALALYEAFVAFDANEQLRVAILTGSGGHFCAGADLTAVAQGRLPILEEEGDIGPMGPSRLQLRKPVVAAVEGYAVAGGLELACWCDLRVAARSATFGVFCRRFGVPLIDGGTLRLPRLIGAGRAMDMILTGRPVHAEEALRFGLADRVVEDGEALQAALQLAETIAGFPQQCMRADRASARSQWSLSEEQALRAEFVLGRSVLSEEALPGARRFASGVGRHGHFSE